MRRSLRYLALGAGVQSTAMLVLAVQEKIPRPDVALFADTGDEPQWVYDQVALLEEWSPIPVERVSAGHLSQDLVDRHNGKKRRFAAIPAFVRGADGRAAPLRRQCTREYKIEPMEKRARALMGYQPRQHIKEHHARCQLGISTDEADRMAPSRVRWITNEFPLLELGYSREHCLEVVRQAGLPEPQKSACVFCPYRSNESWQDLKYNHPEEFAKAVAFDERIRDMNASGIGQPVFLHRTLQPLEDVDLSTHQPSLFSEECSGGCYL